LVGLCILELDLSQKEEKVWREPFERKLDRLRGDLVSTVKRIPNCSPNMVRLEALLDEATVVGRKRNTIIHGTLHHHSGGDLLLKNRAYGGTHPLERTAIDDVTAELASLYDRFVSVRGDCIEARLLSGAHWVNEIPTGPS
jgi:hypothetical protein